MKRSKLKCLKLYSAITVVVVFLLIAASGQPTVKMTGKVTDIWKSTTIAEKVPLSSEFSQLHMVVTIETDEPDHPHEVDFVFDGSISKNLKVAFVEIENGIVVVDLGDTVEVTGRLSFRDWTEGNRINFPFVTSIKVK